VNPKESPSVETQSINTPVEDDFVANLVQVHLIKVPFTCSPHPNDASVATVAP
jgi:hypothetical protein